MFDSFTEENILGRTGTSGNLSDMISILDYQSFLFYTGDRFHFYSIPLSGGLIRVRDTPRSEFFFVWGRIAF